MAAAAVTVLEGPPSLQGREAEARCFRRANYYLVVVVEGGTATGAVSVVDASVVDASVAVGEPS